MHKTTIIALIAILAVSSVFFLCLALYGLLHRLP